MALGTLPSDAGPAAGGSSGSGVSTPSTPASSSPPGASLPAGSGAPGYVDPLLATATPTPSSALVAQYGAYSNQQQQALQDSNLNNTAMANATTQFQTGVDQQQAANDAARLMQQQYRDVTLGYQGDANNRLFAGQQLANQNAAALLARDVGLRANISNAASQGSASAWGTGQNTHDLFNKYGNQIQGNQIGYDQTVANSKLNDKALDSLGKEYGIRGQDIQQQLAANITKLGLDNAQTIATLNQQLASGNAQLQQQAYNFMAQVLALPDTPVNTAAVAKLNAQYQALEAPGTGAASGYVTPNTGAQTGSDPVPVYGGEQNPIPLVGTTTPTTYR